MLISWACKESAKTKRAEEKVSRADVREHDRELRGIKNSDFEEMIFKKASA